MQLSKRLQTVASLVTPGSRVADVGCDHAYTSIYLVEHQISPYVIAMDVNQGPIDRARENVIKFGYKKQIDIRKSNGLEKLKPGEADTVLIAGMGGALTVQILSERAEVVSTLKELILQPQSEIFKVRKMVSESGFIITDENMMIEDGKYYVMMKAERERSDQEKEIFALTREEHYVFGKLLLDRKHPVLLEFLKRERSMNETIYQTLLQEQTENSILRQKEIREKLELIEIGLSYF